MADKSKLYAAVSAAWKAYRQPTGAHAKSVARELMKDSLSPATALFVAAHHLLGPGFTAWEPESLWAQLDIADHNRDKLLSAVTMAVNPAFYWDVRVFGNVSEVFSDGVTNIDTVPCPDVDEMSWAVFEAELLMALPGTDVVNVEFDDPVEAYVAACAHEQGCVLLPENLKFAEPHLTKLLNSDARALSARAKELAAKHPQGAAGRFSPGSTPEGIQVGRLFDANKHVEERADLVSACLRRFQP